MSRYHTPAEITESKDYKEPAKEEGAKQREQEMDTGPGASRLTASRPGPGYRHAPTATVSAPVVLGNHLVGGSYLGTWWQS